MKTTPILVILLALSSCCPEPRIIRVVGIRPALSITPIVVAKSIHSPTRIREEASALPMPDLSPSNLALRKRLEDVRSELKELSAYGGFRCYSGVPDPRTTEFTMTDEQKEAFRKTGEDPDLFLQKWNSIRIEDNMKRARWEELTKTESELVFLLEHAGALTQKAGNTEQAVDGNPH